MRKIMMLLALCSMSIALVSCGAKKENVGGETAAAVESKVASVEAKTESAQAEETEETGSESQLESTLSDEQALAAVKEYCIESNPDLKDMLDSEDYTIYWEVESSEADEIVVLYRSYTGAEVRYYIDPVTGEAYVTEFVPGITEEEQRTDETVNVREYIK